MAQRFKCPKPLGEQPELKLLLDGSKEHVMADIMPGSQIGKNINHFIQKRRIIIRKKWCVVDAHAGNNFRNMMEGVMPCVTRARGGAVGHYVTKLDRFLTAHEMGALQGLPAEAITKMLDALGNDQTTVGKALGDAMSINVLMRILTKVMFTVGVVAKPLTVH